MEEWNTMWNMTNGTSSIKTQKLQEFIVLHSTILFESYTFRRSSFEGLDQPNEIEPIHFKQNLQLSRVKRIVLDYSFSFSWSLRFSPSSCSSSLMVSDGTSRSWVGSSTMVSCINLWVLFGVIRTPQLVDRAQRQNSSEDRNRAPTNEKTTYTNIALHVHWESTDAYIGGDYKLPYIPSYLFTTVVMG